MPGDDVTFIVDRNVNYTNVCVSGCRFCAFYRSDGAPDAYVLTREQLAEKVAETIALDGTAILLQGGMHPDLGIEWYEGMLRDIKADHPGIHVHGFGPPEIVHIAKLSGISDARGARAPARRRTRLAAGRRRRDPRRPRTQSRITQEGHERPVARRDARGARGSTSPRPPR